QDLDRWGAARQERHAGTRLSRGRDHAPYEGPLDSHQNGCRRGHGPRHGMDLRSHTSLYRHQRLLSQLMAHALVLVAAVALGDPDGRVLIAKRPEGKPMAGLWEFPGGKVEDGERPELSLIRELKEELGIDVTEA